MRLINITEYGKRYSWLKDIHAGEGRTKHLHIPNIHSIKHVFIKMLWLINMNEFKTRKEILSFYENNKLIQNILQFENTCNPYVDHYWSELHKYGFIQQYRDSKRIVYQLTTKGKYCLNTLPENEKLILGIKN